MTMEGSLQRGGPSSQTLSLNMKLIAHHELEGFGGIGEGLNMQKTGSSRRVLWMAHESAPKNFTEVDVTDPREPRLVVQTELPHGKMRSNSLDVVGELMAVAYQIRGERGMKPAGFDLFDISTPEQPRLISHFDASGPHSLGVHCLWFVDGEYVHASSGAPDFQPRNPDERCFLGRPRARLCRGPFRGRPLRARDDDMKAVTVNGERNGSDNHADRDPPRRGARRARGPEG